MLELLEDKADDDPEVRDVDGNVEDEEDVEAVGTADVEGWDPHWEDAFFLELVQSTAL